MEDTDLVTETPQEPESPQESQESTPRRKPGRPKGSRDSRPRKPMRKRRKKYAEDQGEKKTLAHQVFKKANKRLTIYEKVARYRGYRYKLTCAEMARRLGIKPATFARKARTEGITAVDMKKILNYDLPGIVLNNKGMCPFLTEGGRILKLEGYKMAVKPDKTVVLIEEPPQEEVIQEIAEEKQCVFCGVREGEESISPKTGEGWHLTGKGCIRIEKNRWICYQCCSECWMHDSCPDKHPF